MARHWSVFTGVSDKQARALDAMAREHGLRDGMDILTSATGMSRSKIGKLDRFLIQDAVDEAFQKYGREATA